jgi:hypothetical protein
MNDRVRRYSICIQSDPSIRNLTSQAPRRAKYHANRAAAFLARGGAAGGGRTVRHATDPSGPLEDTLLEARAYTRSRFRST